MTLHGKSSLKRGFGAIALALSVYALIPMGLDGMVLCIGDDGHLAVEVTGAVCCDPADILGSLGLHTDDACGRCVDIPLPFAAYMGNADRQEFHAPSGATPLQTTLFGEYQFPPGIETNAPLEFPNQSRPLIELHLSVVLLI